LQLLRYADGAWERSIPDVADASRSPDPSAVRRWAERLLVVGTLLATTLWLATDWSAAISSTILAWDWIAIRRILLSEVSSSQAVASCSRLFPFVPGCSRLLPFVPKTRLLASHNSQKIGSGHKECSTSRGSLCNFPKYIQ
jgi:hypothetical protein